MKILVIFKTESFWSQPAQV